MIKAIIFDCFGVLTTDAWRAFVDTLPEDQVPDARELNRQRDAGLINPEEFREQIKELTGRVPNDVQAQSPEEIVKNSQLLNYIAELKGKYAIGMLSNIANNWIRDKFLTLDEQDLFDEMIFSFEVGMTKPDPRIYMLACERLRVGPHEAVLVDDVAAYCEAAESEGLQTVVYEDFSQLKRELNAILNHR